MTVRDDEEREMQSIPASLSSAQIADGVGRSPDGGITLFLSKLGLSDIGAHEATELAIAGRNGGQENDSVVERLALGNNRLTTLPTEFALLTRLRYLNLKHNCFILFPDVLTILPSLDTLDLSYNKLRRLPPYPGNLTRLKILSLSRNKITKLPSYLTQCQKLEVLQVDRNPIDWPPPAVLDTLGDNQDFQNRREWVHKLQNWMEVELARGKEFEDSGYSERNDLKSDRSNYESWRFPMQDKMHNLKLTPHARSFSTDSDVSTSSVLNSTSDIDTTKQTLSGLLDLTTNTKPPTQALDLSEILSTSFTPVSANYLDTLPEPEAAHLRTASHASTLRKSQLSVVTGKKSLPDLRTGRDAKKYQPTNSEGRTTTPDDRFGPNFHQDPGSSYGSLPPYEEDAPPPNHRTVPIVSVERSSYFRRSSNMPTDNSLPQPLRILSLSARGILFALGQLYQTLDQYSHQDGNEHLSTIFRKVLEPANVTMLHLIRSLDRFDDVSQKSTPSPALCRALVESCRDTVTVFRKAAGLLILQLGSLMAEDVRYVRWLVLEWNAVCAELSHTWQCMVAQLESLKPLLSNNFLKPPTFGSSTVIDDHLTPSVRLRPAEVTQAGRTRTARRHAGSFSTKDVQIGKELPSYDVVPSMAGGLASDSQTPTLRTPKRQMTLPVVTSTPNALEPSFIPSFTAPPYSGSFSESFYHHHGHSQGSIPEGTTLASPAFVYNSNSVSQRHSKVLQAIQRTVDLAPVVWDQIEVALSDLATSNQDIHESIEQARSVTKRLSDDVSIMSEGYSDADERLLRENAHLFVKALVLLSNTLKTYVAPRSVSSSLRANLVTLTQSTEDFAVLLPISSIPSCTAHSYSPTFSNSQYSPYNGISQNQEDHRLPSSLSRSKSEQPPILPPSLSRSKSEQPPIRSAKQSLALSHATTAPLFTSRTTVTKRLRRPPETSIEKADPG